MVLAVSATDQGSTAARTRNGWRPHDPTVSIPVREPQHIPEVLAELMGGKCFPLIPAIVLIFELRSVV